MSIQVRNLTKIYGSQKAVDSISFSAGKGDIIGFLGPNGAGKSTTMKIATCFLPPTSGTIEVAGYDVQQHPMEVRRSVGYLPEHNPLYTELYVHEALEFAASLFGLPADVKRRRIAELIEMTGLEREQHKRISALSKGYRQRVGLAQALLHDPPVLILDEPTTGLDPNQILEIRQLIRQISAEKTVVFSTHIMQEVQALCNRVVIISKGKIVSEGSLEALKGQAGNRLLLETQAAPAPAAFTEALSQLPGVAHLQTEGGTIRLSLHTDAPDLRAEIFQTAVRTGTILVTMQQETASLESIFTNLTT